MMKMATAVITASLILLLAGCYNLNQKATGWPSRNTVGFNWNNLKEGMSVGEVEMTIGLPAKHESTETKKTYYYPWGGTVWFDFDKVIKIKPWLYGGNSVRGHKIYKKHCASCHGWKSVDLGYNALSREDVIRIVRDGVPGKGMFAYKERLTVQELKDVIDLMRTYYTD